MFNLRSNAWLEGGSNSPKTLLNVFLASNLKQVKLAYILNTIDPINNIIL